VKAKYPIAALFFWSITLSVFAQDSINLSKQNSNYREDQIYFAVTYNLISQVPSEINLKGLSGGISLGVLRDMPLNKRRNVAIAIGAGISFDRYGQTLSISEGENEASIFSILTSDIRFDKNRFSTYTIELPLEFRWRTSTATQYKFWRIYGGVKAGYTFRHRSFFKLDNTVMSHTNIREFVPLRLAATLSFGYGSALNFHVNYTLNSFFKEANIEGTGQVVGFNPVKLGIVFYLL